MSLRIPSALSLVLFVVGCGGPPPSASIPTPSSASASEVPTATADSESAPVEASYPTEREVLIDGVRDGVVMGSESGFSLVAGNGTVALVGPDGHVRASYRFAYGSDVAAAFVTPNVAIVANTDQDGYVGSHGGEVDRWHLDSMTIEMVQRLGYDLPVLGRLGDTAYFGSEYDDPGIHAVTATSVENVAEQTSVACPSVSPPFCVFSDSERSMLVTLDDTGDLVRREIPVVVPIGTLPLAIRWSTEEPDHSVLVSLPSLNEVVVQDARDGEHPVSSFRSGTRTSIRFEGPSGMRDYDPELGAFQATDAPAPEPEGLVPSLGASGIPGLDFAPRAAQLALATSSVTVVLGPDGFGPQLDVGTGGSVSWLGSERGLRVGYLVVPFDVPVRVGLSAVTSEIYPGDYDEAGPPPLAISLLSHAGGEAPELPTVCTPAGSRPARCLRTVVEPRDERIVLAGWELFDPARPARAVARFAWNVPVDPTIALLPAGARIIRAVDLSGRLSLLRPDGQTSYGPVGANRIVEFESGWVVGEGDRVTAVSSRGAVVERTFETEVGQIERVEGDRALLIFETRAELVDAHTLVSEASYPFDGPAPHSRWRCRAGELADYLASGDTPDEPCPVGPLGAREREVPADEESRIAFEDLELPLSFDRAFWAEPRGEVVLVHRVADDATLSIRITSEGVLVTGPGGIFESNGSIGDHLVVREPGPVRTAPITVGGAARARFERPGLVAAFFRGEPLGTGR